MAMFHLEGVFLFELALFAAGLVLLHFARLGSAPLLRAAGLVLVVGSVLTAACTLYYGVRYHVQGEFESAYPPHRMMTPRPGGPHGMMHPMHPRGPHAERPTPAPPALETPEKPAPPAAVEPEAD